MKFRMFYSCNEDAIIQNVFTGTGKKDKDIDYILRDRMENCLTVAPALLKSSRALFCDLMAIKSVLYINSTWSLGDHQAIEEMARL